MTPRSIIEAGVSNCGGWALLSSTVGATRQSLYRWRNGAVPSPRFWFALAFAADVDVSQVLSAWQVGQQGARKPLAQKGKREGAPPE